MNKIRRYLASLLAIIFLFINGLQGSCSWQSKQAYEKERFDLFLNNMFVNSVQASTLTLNSSLAAPENYGIDDTEITLGKYGIQQMNESMSDTKSYLENLHSFQYDLLTRDQRLTYDILDYSLQNINNLYNYNLYLNEYLSPAIGAQAHLPIILAEYNFYEKEDIEEYIELLPCIYGLFEEILQFEREKSAQGLFMCDAVAKRIIDQCKTFIDKPEENYLITYFNEKAAAFQGLTKDEIEDYQERNKEAVLKYVIPAYEMLIAGITELLGTGTNDAGLYYYVEGKAYYESAVKYVTGSEKSIPEMIKMLEKAINKNHYRLISMSEADYKLAKEFKAFPVTDPQKIINDLKYDIKKDFPDITSSDCRIELIPQSLSDYLNPAMYIAPPLDRYLDNTIYINGNDSETLSMIYTTIAHEGYPGHLYQYVYLRSRNFDLVRKILNFTGYIEGWAEYAENYSYYTSGIDKDLAEILSANEVFTLCLSARADIGINYEGWTRDKVVKYIKAYQYDEEIGKEVYRILMEEPGLYLPYAIGYLEIMELREKAESELGIEFNLKEFHKFLLDIGPAPFGIIEEQEELWLQEKEELVP